MKKNRLTQFIFKGKSQFFLSMLGVLLFASVGYSQGTSCATGIALSPTVGSPFTLAAQNTADGGDTTDDNACGVTSSYDGGDDLFFTYVAPSPLPAGGDFLTISVDGSSIWGGVFVADITGGDCAGTATTTSAVDVVGFTLEAGHEYCVHVSTWPAPQSMTFDITATLSADPTPANDLCDDAESITLDPNSTVNVNATTLFSSNTNAPANCPTVLPGTGNGGSVSGQSGIWYTFTGDGNTYIFDFCGSPIDVEVALYEGSCGALNCIGDSDDNNVACPGNNDPQFFVDAAAGTTYYLYVSQFSGAGGDFSLAISAACAINAVSAVTVDPCDAIDNSYSVTLSVDYIAAPGTGSLTVNGQDFPITGSPQQVTLTGLDSDGADVDVDVSFTDDAACTASFPAVYTAPARCSFCMPVCPAGPFVYNLLPGECDIVVNYPPVTTTGGCDNVTSNFVDAFNVANWTADAPDGGSVNTAGAPASIIINGADASGAGTFTYSIVALEATTISFDYSATIPGDSWFWDSFGYVLNGTYVELTPGTGTATITGTVSLDLAAGDIFGFAGETTDGLFGFSVTTISNFTFTSLVTPELVSGPASGETVGIGTTPVIYQTVDPVNGQTFTCTFDVIVNEFANPTATLACNDGVQVSLDETCSATIGADMILEGGPYGCYDDYVVMVLSPLNAPLGNVVNYSFVGSTWTVKVTDTDTGNSCWGSIIVEDKLAPTIECEPITVPCTADLTPVNPATAPIAEQVKTFSSSPGTAINNTLPPTEDVLTIDAGNPGTILDLNLSVDISHTWIGDLTIELTSPSGTTETIFLVNGGCSNDDIISTFDDEAALCGSLCTDFSEGNEVQPTACIGNPGGFLSAFDGEDINGDWTITVTDGVGGDNGVLNSWSLEATYLGPKGDVFFPVFGDNCSVASVDYSDATVNGDCGGPAGTVIRTWTVEDESGNTDQCTQVITIARPTLDDVDVPGNVTWDCTQYAAWPNIIEPTHLHQFFQDCDAATDVIELTCYDHTCNDNALNDPEYCDDPCVDNTDQFGCTVNPLPCTSPFNVPNPGLENEDLFQVTGSGEPTVGGKPLVDICEISVDVEDITINVCDGTFKIVRKWTLIDWCSDPVDVREFNQVVKVVDETAPAISFGGDYLPNSFPGQLYTIDVYDASAPGSAPHQVCEGSVVAPPALNATDDCSGVDGYTTEIWTVDNMGNPVAQIGSVPSNGGIFFDIPLFQDGVPARYVLRYYAVDGCNNQSFGDLYIRVNDRVPPVAICDEITEVSITNNGLNTGESCSTLWAEDLDDGSYDNCSPVFFLISDMSSTNPALWRFRPSIDYCCEDLGDNMAVVAVIANNGTTSAAVDNFLNSLGYVPGNSLVNAASSTFIGQVNTCMVEVEVTDKLAPVLISCPADTRILCDDYAATLETQLANAADDEEACDVLTAAGYGEATFLDNCSLNVNCDFTNAIDQCLEGFVRRRWTASDDAGNNSLQTCTQRIFVDHVSDWAVEFPADITVDCGTDVPDFGEPEIFFETCELVAISHDDELFTTVPDACYKILRTWQVINWCVVGDDIDEEVEELSEAELWNQGITNLSDRDINNDGFFSPNVNTQSGRTFRDSWYNNGDGVSNVLDKPNASIATQTFNPDTDVDSDPWDGFITYQQVIKVIDEVDPVFTNGCEIPDVCIEDNTCGATVLLPSPEIDECSDNVNLTAQITIGGATLNGFGPYLNVSPGVYNVRYVAMDNCNNQTACETTVTVADCKKPTPYCKNGIIIEIMQTGMVDVWASDLNDNSFDNCPGALKFSFSSDVDDTGITFTCDDLGQQPVELWVTDAAGNQDFCETFVIIQDNMFSCEGDDPLVAGITATEDNLGVEGVAININSPSGFNTDITTNTAGTFSAPVTSGGDYTLTPVLDVEPLNGVSTFDLVLISKHILGVQPLDSPYKIIAADANRSNSLTTFDMVQIRKLILFIDTEFANNTSWRFFDANCTFSNPADPFSDMCSEVVSLNDVTADQLANDFVAVKVGDVNGTAATNLLGSADDRTMVGDLVLDVEDMDVQKGERYTIDFKATDFNVSGYQFTLNFDNKALDFVEVGAGLANASNFGLSMVEEGVLTASWNSNEAKKMTAGEVVFSLTFDANQNGQLSDLLGLNSRYTVAEAYNADAQLLNVALSFNSDVVADGFELFQNTPNPFASTTTIGFYLPEATSATLTISDVQGKVVKVINGDFAEGYNTVNLKRGDMNANGVLYYRLDAGADSATRMMILVD